MSRRLLFSAFVFFCLLLTTELFLRRFWPLSLDPPVVPLLRGDLTIPGDHPIKTAEYSVTVHVNQAGFVDREWGPKSRPRVIVLGDSFVQAAQVGMEEGFGRVLGRRMPEMEVLSLGVPGAGTATEMEVLETYGMPLQPDVVLIGVLVANDVLNNHPRLEKKSDKPFYTIEEGGLRRIDPQTGEPPSFLALHLQIAARVERSVRSYQMTQEKIALGQGIPIDLQLYDPNPSPVWEEAWAVTSALLQAISARCAAAHIPLGIILFPDGNQASPAFRARTLSRWPTLSGRDFSAPVHRMAALSAPLAPTLDLLPTFSGQDSAYLQEDGHWTPLGHQLAAEATAGWLRQFYKPPP